MSGRNLTLALGALAVGLGALGIAGCSDAGSHPPVAPTLTPTAAVTPAPTLTATATPTATPTATATPTPQTCTQTTLGVDPTTNARLAADCNTLLAAKDGLRGTATLNWSADTAMTDWDGVSLGGTPVRVTGLNLDSRSLTGSIPAGLGSLAGLRRLGLNNNLLTGDVPAELASLSALTHVTISGNMLTGCVPGVWADVPNNDLEMLGLPYCGITLSYHSYDTTGRAMTAGSHAFLADATAMTSVSNPFRGSASFVTAILVNTTDGDGKVRSAFYDSITVGDIVEWVPTADEDCWRRYKVTAIQPPPPGDPQRRIFAVEWLPLFEDRCKTREIAGDAGSLAVELRWRPPAARRDSVTGLLTMLQQQPVGAGTYLVAPHALLIIDVPAGMMLVRTTGLLLSAGFYPVALEDVTSGSILVLDFDSGTELGRTMYTVEGDTRDVGALFDAIVTSARIFVEGE